MTNETHLVTQFPFDHGICHRMPVFPSSQPTNHERDQATDMFVAIAKWCPFEVEHWIRSNVDKENNQLSRFDVIVIGTGIWEAVRAPDCRNWSSFVYSDQEMSKRSHLQIAEDTMRAAAEYIKIQWARHKQRVESGLPNSAARYPTMPMIVWRTAGYDQNVGHELMDNMNRHVIDLYETLIMESNVDGFRMADYFRLVDSGGAVRPRSFHR
jgi:hypothetical protein